MLELLKIKKDINWLIDQVKCLVRKKDLDSPLSATEWSPNHSIVTGNPYILDCFVWFEGHVYKSLIDDNNYPPTNDCYWADLGIGHLLLEEQSNWDATTGRPFIRNKPTKTSDFINDGENGTSPFVNAEDIPIPNLQSVTNEGNVTSNAIVINPEEDEAPALIANHGGVPTGVVQIYSNGYNEDSKALFVNGGDSTAIYAISNYSEEEEDNYNNTISCANLSAQVTASALYIQSPYATAIRSYTNYGIAEEINLGYSSKGIVINSGNSSTGNPITINKNGVDKLIVNQQGELTATKLIKQGGNPNQFLMADGSTSTLPPPVIPTLQSVTTQGAVTNKIVTFNNEVIVTPSPTGRSIYCATSDAIGLEINLNETGGTGILIKRDDAPIAIPFQYEYYNGDENSTTVLTKINTAGEITATKFKTPTGTLTQFLKANGSTDSTTYYSYPTGSASQYIRGDGQLASFPDIAGGGGGQVYYCNGGTSQGTINTSNFYQLSTGANLGTGTNFTSGTVNDIAFANFITDIGKPTQEVVPAGVWIFQCYLSASASNVLEVYATIEVYNGSTFYILATSLVEVITNGTTVDLYTFTCAVPEYAPLTTSDRIAIRFYPKNLTAGRTITLYTQNSNLSSVQSTFTTGLAALNGLTSAAQLLATGTTGNDFNIDSTSATHTFNIPNASSAANRRGLLTASDWTTFNNKLTPNTTIIGATKTKITYDSKGLVTSGTDATTADIADSTDKRYVSDAQKIIIGNTSGTNTGDNATNTQYSGLVTSKEDALGNPSTNGYVLSSTTAGVRSWIAQTGGASGTLNYISKFTGTTILGDSQIFDNGTNIGIGTITPTAKLEVLDTNFPVTKITRSTALITALRSTFAAKHLTSGDMADGFGSDISFIIQDNSTIENEIANFGAVRDGADNNGALIFATRQNGSRYDRMKLFSDGRLALATDFAGVTSSPQYKLYANGSQYLQNITQQLFSDDFNRVSPNVGGVPTITYSINSSANTIPTILSNQLRIPNSLSTSGYTCMTGTMPISYDGDNVYNTTLEKNIGLLTWSFNFRTGRSTALEGFAPGQFGLATILCSNSIDSQTVGAKGYAVYYINNQVFLVNFNNGLSAYSIVTAVSPLGLAQDYYSVRVTYDCGTTRWNLEVRNDGAVAFSIPSSGIYPIQSGFVSNPTPPTPISMPYFGWLWNFNATTTVQSAFFDNFNFSILTGGNLAVDGSISIGTTIPNVSAKLEVTSTTQGFLPPRMTNAQRLAIPNPPTGLMVYCLDATEGLYIRKSAGWTFII